MNFSINIGFNFCFGRIRNYLLDILIREKYQQILIILNKKYNDKIIIIFINTALNHLIIELN